MTSAIELAERGDQLRGELSGADRLGPAAKAPAELGGDLDLQLASVEANRDRALRAAQDGGDGGPRGARPRGKRLPHAPFEDAGPHGAALDADEGDVRAVGEEVAVLDLRPQRRQVQALHL